MQQAIDVGIAQQHQSQSSSETAEQLFRRLLDRYPKLHGVIATDKDGVVLVQALDETLDGKKLDSTFAGTFSLLAEQASKLHMGKNNTITMFFSNLVIIHINDLPLTITLIADETCNVGAFLSIAPDLKAKLQPIRNAVQADEMQ